METIYETYIRELCNNCKNRKQDLCEIREDINGTLKCCYYIKDKHIEGYKKPLIRLAEQQKTLMKLNI